MGYIQEEHIVQKRLVLTSSDVAKHNMRMKRRHEDYVSTPGMTAFCRHLGRLIHPSSKAIIRIGASSITASR